MSEDILDAIEKERLSSWQTKGLVYMKIYIIVFSVLTIFFFFGISFFMTIGASIDLLLLGIFFIVLSPALYVILWHLTSIKYEKNKSINLFNKKRFLILGMLTALISLFYVGFGVRGIVDGLASDVFGMTEFIFGFGALLNGIFCLIFVRITTKKWQKVTAKHVSAELIDKYMNVKK